MNNLSKEYAEESRNYLMNSNEFESNNSNINHIISNNTNKESDLNIKIEKDYSNIQDQTTDFIYPKSSNSIDSSAQKSSQQYNPSNKPINSNNINNSNKPRRPINANVEENIYSLNSNASFISRNNNIKSQLSNSPHVNKRQPGKVAQNENEQNITNFTNRKISPTRSVDNGPKILKRELWWKGITAFIK
jgi:hypothetical protein